MPALHESAVDTPIRPLRMTAERSTEDRLFDLLASQGKQATAEREKLAGAFSASLNGLRSEIRVIVLLAFVLLAARDGVLTRLRLGSLSVETTQAAAAAIVPTASEAP